MSPSLEASWALLAVAWRVSPPISSDVLPRLGVRQVAVSPNLLFHNLKPVALLGGSICLPT